METLRTLLAIIDELAVISPLLPPIVKGLVVVLVGIAVWAILSVPAYWLSRALGEPLRRLSDLLARLRAALFAMVRARFDDRVGAVEQFIAEHRQVVSFAEENDGIERELRQARNAIEELPRKWSGLETSMGEAQKVTKDAALAIQRIHWPDAVEPPAPSQYAQIQVERNDAWLQLPAFFLIAALLVAINTVMLKEFFASFVPPLRVLGLPLAVALAFLFSLLEVAFGVIMASLEGRKGGTLMIWRSLLFVAIASLALIEFGFYARFGAELDFDPFSTLWAPDPPPNWTKLWLGIFGPMVVLGMALCGHMAFIAWRTLFRDHVVRQYRKFLEERTRKADELQSKLDSAQKAASVLIASLKEIAAHFKPTADALAAGAQQISEVQPRVSAALDEAQQIRLEPHHEIGRAEMLRLFYSCLFKGASVVVAFLVLALAFGSFGVAAQFEIDGLKIPGFALAIGETVFMLGVGLATEHLTARLLPVADGPRIFRIHSWGIWAAFVAAGAVIGANAVAFAIRGSLFDLMWFALTCAAAFWLVVVGRRLGLIVAALWAFAQSVLVSVACAALYVAAAALVVLKVLVDVLGAAIGLLAFPFVALFRREHRSTGRAVAGSAIGAALVIGVILAPPYNSVLAQQFQQDPHSSISVLVDLSSTWLSPRSASENKRILKTVAEGIERLASEIEPPIVVRYLPIGDMSFVRTPLCEVTFAPKLLQSREGRAKEVTSLKALAEYLEKSCVEYVLSRKQEKFTDLRSAFDSVARLTEEQAGPFKAVLILSDMKEERRKNQKPIKLRLPGVRLLILYRVLDEDRLDPSALDARIDAWKRELAEAGAQVSALADLAASPSQISRVLLR